MDGLIYVSVPEQEPQDLGHKEEGPLLFDQPFGSLLPGEKATAHSAITEGAKNKLPARGAAEPTNQFLKG